MQRDHNFGGGVKCGALSGLVSFWAPSIVKNVDREHIAVACLLSFAFECMWGGLYLENINIACCLLLQAYFPSFDIGAFSLNAFCKCIFSSSLSVVYC